VTPEGVVWSEFVANSSLAHVLDGARDERFGER
jgi:hypothetical protein